MIFKHCTFQIIKLSSFCSAFQILRNHYFVVDGEDNTSYFFVKGLCPNMKYDLNYP